MIKSPTWIWVLIIVLILIVLGGVTYFLIPKKGSESAANTSSTPAGSTKESKLVALGASITRANNLSSSQVGDNNDYSFATGTKIESLFSYLKGKNDKLTGVNLAESGASSQDVLQEQLPNALSYKPTYATVDVTADIFTSSETGTFRMNLTQIVSQLKKEGVIVLVGSYPNFFSFRTADIAVCKEDKLNIGINRLTPETLQKYNQTIKEVAQEQKAIFVDIYNVLGPTDVSDYDCIHANLEGQKKLAQTWINALPNQ